MLGVCCTWHHPGAWPQAEKQQQLQAITSSCQPGGQQQLQAITSSCQPGGQAHFTVSGGWGPEALGSGTCTCITCFLGLKDSFRSQRANYSLRLITPLSSTPCKSVHTGKPQAARRVLTDPQLRQSGPDCKPLSCIIKQLLAHKRTASNMPVTKLQHWQPVWLVRHSLPALHASSYLLLLLLLLLLPPQLKSVQRPLISQSP